MRTNGSDALRCLWDLCRWLQNISPGITGTAQEFIDCCPRGPDMQFTLQPLYNPRQHLNIGIGAVCIRTITVKVCRQAANLMFLLQWKQRVCQRQSGEDCDSVGKLKLEIEERLRVDHVSEVFTALSR